MRVKLTSGFGYSIPGSRLIVVRKRMCWKIPSLFMRNTGRDLESQAYCIDIYRLESVKII